MLLKTVKTIRNHWKKSIFGGVVVSYGAIYLKNFLQEKELMHAYCQKAVLYGKEPLSPHLKARQITVILNPSANKRKALKEFDKYCAPLFYLAGISIEVKKTESEGHAKRLTETLSGTDALVVAGGDGTLSEVITGLLRKTQEDANQLVPIGILPLGKSNLTAKSVFQSDNLGKVKSLANATIAVIEQAIKPIDIMKIEILEESNKPIYAVNSIKWGAYRDADVKRESYWYFGPLRKYAIYIFNGLKSNISWKCDAILNYNLPCDGCSNCYTEHIKVQPISWLHKFIKTDNQSKKFASIINPNCSKSEEKNVSTVDLKVLVNNVSNSFITDTSKLIVEIGPNNINYIDYVKNGMKIEKGEKADVEEIVEARMIKLYPQNLTDRSWFSIDSEEYEVKPIKITLLPKLVNIFCIDPNK